MSTSITELFEVALLYLVVAQVLVALSTLVMLLHFTAVQVVIVGLNSVLAFSVEIIINRFHTLIFND